jgi:hypothetical protein
MEADVLPITGAIKACPSISRYRDVDIRPAATPIAAPPRRLSSSFHLAFRLNHGPSMSALTGLRFFPRLVFLSQIPHAFGRAVRFHPHEVTEFINAHRRKKR